MRLSFCIVNGFSTSYQPPHFFSAHSARKYPLIQTAADMRYLHDLNVQISQNRRSVSVSKQMDRDLCNQHFDTFETFWGRPGHGARGDKINKLKLDNLLYGASESA
ncbi:uncharacterized protein LOC110191371 [Drosophila serrata]|uniref:uncharacterized protein LOC110191371 n=1 Tax=Drosophila serrata TaxID=7274 RepID=UPI000A1D0E03|nr:uncharacterized protein LOC110191371 [Drosophila serrata]